MQKRLVELPGELKREYPEKTVLLHSKHGIES